MSNDQASETTPAPVPDPVRRGALRRPQAPALIGPAGRAFSYGALEAAVERGTERLAMAGVGEGDRVACLLPREPAYVVLLMALWRRRAVAAPLPARTPPAGRVRLLEAIGARTLVAAGPAATKAPERVRVLAAPDLVGGLPGEVDDERAPPNESAWLLSLPLYHVGGLAVVLRCLWAGATVAFPREDEPLAPALRRTGATHASLVAAQLRRLLEAAPHDDAGTGVPASMTALLLGGGPAPPTLIEAAHRAGWPVAVSYGLTEMASQVATTAPGDPLDALLHTAGRPLAHRRVRIRGGPDGEASREGDIGEILVHGRTRFAGYVTGGGRRPRRSKRPCAAGPAWPRRRSCPCRTRPSAGARSPSCAGRRVRPFPPRRTLTTCARRSASGCPATRCPTPSTPGPRTPPPPASSPTARC
ncbi:MAG: hypothetical protein BRD29_02580 [Bacteroidetes bacterium QH_2_67_10]|nr:MAG: hypothetical protein BRD29_02580 [Bacteroidetes bacterium QH_2_67_10]